MPADHDALDVLVVGSGIAGLSVALAIAGRRRVAVIAKEAGGGGSTLLAQGGIAAAVAPGDTGAAHAADTMAAAAGLGDPRVAEAVTAEAAGAVATLADLGVRFDAGALGKEGGHSVPRVVHARGDATGAEISHALLEEAARRAVPLTAGAFLVDLLVAPDGSRVVGALVSDSRSGMVRAVRANTVVLATGGYGQLWASTTSPRACSGDGLAAAFRAGAQLADLEFVQFHPTGMALGGDPRPLATEALRGAGARLRDAAGDYVNGIAAGDLAPRDVVSRAMTRRMTELGADHCFLDATGLGRDLLEEHFPTFVATCRAGGLSPEADWAPVSPTAHYTMGGVLTDADGRTTLEGLMAVGEVGCSGLHGANRLASNSLLEGAVIGRRAAEAILDSSGPVAAREAADLDEVLEPVPASAGIASDGCLPLGQPLGRGQLRSAMQAHAGVSCDAGGLAGLGRYLASAPAPEVMSGRPGEVELANMKLVATAVVAMAARRQESRGAHWRTDFPSADEAWRRRQVVQLLPGGEMAVGELEVGTARHRVAGTAAAAV